MIIWVRFCKKNPQNIKNQHQNYSILKMEEIVFELQHHSALISVLIRKTDKETLQSVINFQSVPWSWQKILLTPAGNFCLWRIELWKHRKTPPCIQQAAALRRYMPVAVCFVLTLTEHLFCGIRLWFVLNYCNVSWNVCVHVECRVVDIENIIAQSVSHYTWALKTNSKKQ